MTAARPASVIIASNRGPVSFRRNEDGTIYAARGSGGLVTGMAGLGADGGALWVCAAMSDADREVANEVAGGRLDLAGYETGGPVAMLPIDPQILDDAYNAIANTTLWYLHHGLADPTHEAEYDDRWRAQWAAYVAYNRSFAKAIASTAAADARVLVQDYHLTLVPAMLRELRSDVRIGHFSHTPWASPEVFGTLPADIANELLVGMLGADSAGFHSRRWAEDFTQCCVRFAGATAVDGGVEHDGRRTAVRVHPLGVDAAPLRERAAQPDVVAFRDEMRERFEGVQTVVRVDRTEPSKNLVGGLEAFRELLVRHPEHLGHVIHVPLAYPSRQDLADYRRYTERVVTLAAEINEELATATWSPVLLEIEDDYPKSLALLSIGDVMLINPVRDGMNLVAKESALLSPDCVLVLSQEAGAADEMEGSALLVDPLDITATADALHAALTMPVAERQRRHLGLVAAATSLPPKEWLRAQLEALD